MKNFRQYNKIDKILKNQFILSKMRISEQRKREKMRELQRMADRVCSLILIQDYPEIDIEIERSKVRERCEELYPDRMNLYEMIYESRFDRLWEQFREQYEYDED